MAIFGSKIWLIDDDLQEKNPYTIPAMIRNIDDEKGMSLKKSIILSAILHPTLAGAICLVVFILAFMGITFSIFDRPKPKMNDIEFILIDNVTRTPLNKNTLNRSHTNTRTGGNHNKTREVSQSSASPTKKSVQQKQSSEPKVTKKNVQKKTTQQEHQKNILKSIMQPKAAPQAKPQPHPTRPQLRPSIKPPSIPRPTMKPSSPFAVPIPKPNSTGKSYSTGPIVGHGTTNSIGMGGSGRNSRGGNYAPVPSLTLTGGGGGHSSGSRMSKGGSGDGYSGNPGGGGGATGIDSIGEFDMGPYIRDVERRIKMNWEPPNGNESKRATVLMKIGRDGRLISRSISKSSGIPNFDKAAINAVELAAPYRPLPVRWKQQTADINFLFEFNLR